VGDKTSAGPIVRWNMPLSHHAEVVITVGIDVAAQPERTAGCWIRWDNGVGTVEQVEQPLADDRLRSILADDSVNKVGIDVPLGWPTAFVAAIGAYYAGKPWPAATTSDLIRRVTDWHVRQATQQLPLSLSTDRIAYPAMRIAALLPVPTDRTGEGRIVEVYPAAALRRWGLPWQQYKRTKGLTALGELLTGLRHAAPWLGAEKRWWSWFEARDDAFDALVASLVARASARGLCDPIPSEHVAVAQAEGWIALPKENSLPDLAVN
jgi:predicted nuclease with RNAse H fold